MLKIKDELFIDITGITITGISYYANGIRKSGGGYLWHFV